MLLFYRLPRSIFNPILHPHRSGCGHRGRNSEKLMTDPYKKISASETIFVADSHFRDRRLPGEARRRAAFARLLEAVPSDGAVILLGDIFDFYFEYASVVSKRYFDIYNALYQCSSRGVDVHFLGGNHDYWFNNFLQDEIGVTSHGEHLFAECQGRRIWCTHGDLFMPGNQSYKTIRSILRNRHVIAAAKIIHPDLMDAIAKRVSYGSKSRNRGSIEDMAKQLAERPTHQFFSRTNDVFAMGHVHYPLHQRKNGNDFLIVGDWITQFTYGKMKDGRISLETFSSEVTD